MVMKVTTYYTPWLSNIDPLDSNELVEELLLDMNATFPGVIVFFGQKLA